MSTPGKVARTSRLSAPNASNNSAGPSPGKRALTDGMSRREEPDMRTGVPIVDEGYGCDQQEEGDSERQCGLSPEKRRELGRVLADRVDAARSAYDDALSECRVELMVSKESGWGFVAELVFNVLSFTIVGAVVKAAAAMRKGASTALDAADLALVMPGAAAAASKMPTIALNAAAAIPIDSVTDTLAHVGRAVRSHVKGKASHLPPTAAAKAEFLALMQTQNAQHAEVVAEFVPTTLDDAGLALLVEAYSRPHHTVPIYRAEVDKLAARFDSHEIALVGQDFMRDPGFGPEDTPHQGRLDVVCFVAGTRARRAMVQQWTGYTSRAPAAAEPERASYWVPQPMEFLKQPVSTYGQPQQGTPPMPTTLRSLETAKFVRWVDDDLADVAEQTHRARVGDVLTVDARQADLPNMPEVKQWATADAQ